MNVLITGGAGFIGSHMADYHLHKNDSVWAVDSLITGNEKNLEEAKKNPKFKYSISEVSNWEKLGDAVQWADRIYHFAAYVGQYLVLKHPLEVLSKNIQSLETILQLLKRKKKQCALLVASSSEVYGDTSESFREDEKLIFPSGEYLQQTYRLSKLVNETMALSFQDVKQLVIIRLFNTIGLRQSKHYGMVVPAFISQAIHGIPLTVFGNGLQTRSFCHVSDAIKAMDLLLSAPNANRQIVNVGGEEEISMLDLAKRILLKTKSSSPIEFVDYKKAYGFDFKDIPRRRPSLTKLRSLIDFSPQFTLDAILDAYIGTHFL